MTERIVVGFDGSDAAYDALDWAAARASRHGGGRIDIVSVNPLEVFAYGTVDEAQRDAARRVRAVAPDVIVHTSVHSGSVPETLIRAAADADADVLTVGANPDRPLRSAFRGWRPLRTAAASPGPVVIVPHGHVDAKGPVVAGVDADDSSIEAVRFGADEAADRGVELTLVHAWTVPEPETTGAAAILASPAALREEHAQVLAAARSRAATTQPGLVVNAILHEGEPVDAILDNLDGASLLVLGTHHRGTLEAALVGSVERDLLARSRTPLCIVSAGR